MNCSASGSRWRAWPRSSSGPSTPAIRLWLQDHRVAGEVVMPMTAYLEACLAAARQHGGEGVHAIENIEVSEAMPLPEGESRVMQVSIDQGEAGTPARVRVFSRNAARDDGAWVLHATAAVAAVGEGAMASPAPLAERFGSLPDHSDAEAFYQRMHQRGIDFGAGFRCMKRVRSGAGEAIGEIEFAEGEGADAAEYLLHPALLDACFHASGGATDSLPGTDDGRMYLPVGVDRYQWWQRPSGSLFSHVTVRGPAVRGDTIVFDIDVQTRDGRPVARLEGLRCRRANREMFRQRIEAKVGEWLYDVAWRPQPRAAAGGTAGEGIWLILDDGAGRGERPPPRSPSAAARPAASGLTRRRPRPPQR
ncbi:hypothetical protein FSC37_09575 [Piscinibacter aquaticus]|uniref:PKS/mFAS DH domain-containing protein n=1 Tax=Piscinibacter aquaticus TaxID=392597 RepID=A0A5C6TZP7_9BURK|nr:hypothetical protein FSC37_09575 [Piscinibacter aquaticus]